MLEVVIATQAVVIVAMAGFMMNQYARLMRAAMSRTPGEYRTAEKDATRKPAPTPSKNMVDLDEATQLVLASVSAGSPMPHGLGGD